MPADNTPPLLPALLRELRRLPFLPLQIRVADGRSFDIAHSDFCIVEDDQRTCTICDDLNRVHFVALGCIVSVERDARP
jgi:hypothetical protein